MGRSLEQLRNRPLIRLDAETARQAFTACSELFCATAVGGVKGLAFWFGQTALYAPAKRVIRRELVPVSWRSTEIDHAKRLRQLLAQNVHVTPHETYAPFDVLHLFADGRGGYLHRTEHQQQIQLVVDAFSAAHKDLSIIENRHTAADLVEGMVSLKQLLRNQYTFDSTTDRHRVNRAFQIFATPAVNRLKQAKRHADQMVQLFDEEWKEILNAAAVKTPYGRVLKSKKADRIAADLGLDHVIEFAARRQLEDNSKAGLDILYGLYREAFVTTKREAQRFGRLARLLRIEYGSQNWK